MLERCESDGYRETHIYGGLVMVAMLVIAHINNAGRPYSFFDALGCGGWHWRRCTEGRSKERADDGG